MLTMSRSSSFVRLISALSIIFTMVAGTFAATPVAQAFTQNPAAVFINEIHYDNTGGDVDEFVEIAGPAGTNLTGWSIVLYNGNGGAAYTTTALSGTIPNQSGGFGTVAVSYPTSIQNGAPDGIALVNNGTLVQFLSYEGSFSAVGGAANGVASTDIGVSQAGTEPVGTSSLHLIGSGSTYQNFTWAATTTARSVGAVNNGQTFIGSDTAPTVTSTVPANGATAVAIGSNITVNFSESVDVAAGAISIECPNGNAVASNAAANDITSVVIDPASDLPFSTACTIEVTASAVTDNDGPADAMSADFSASFTTEDATPSDTAPSVSSTSPANGATNVAVGSNITVTFSEPVSAPASAFSLNCGSAVAFSLSGGPTSFTLDPNADLPISASCTLAVDGDQVSDNDAIDPPDVAADFSASFTTAGPVVACSAADTLVGTVQGEDDTTDNVGSVTVQGVVVGDYEGASPALRGFYLQDSGDSNPLTSDGIFVFNDTLNSVSLGQVVQVTGTASEFQGQTQLGGSLVIESCGSTSSVTPTDIAMPFPAAVAGVPYLERFEGMLVRLAQRTYVTELFQLGRFGQITLTGQQDRLRQPTNVVLPGAPAQALQAANDLNKIILDDELQNQNRDPITFGRGANPLTADNTLRGGDYADNIVGLLNYTWGGNSASPNAYRLRPINALSGGLPTFVANNPRPSAPPTVGGDLKVASFNVLNYFLTLDVGTQPNCGPVGSKQECRGAETTLELERQQQKLIPALLKLDADILGLIELENSENAGGIDVEILLDIVTRLNTELGSTIYGYVDTGIVGTDTIRVGFIYKLAKATPIGSPAIDSDPAYSRPPVAQLFEDNDGARFNVVVNHFKSKGCDGASGANTDQGDGQGCFNAQRLLQANALIGFINDTLAPADPDVLVIGDLNAYAKEQPVAALEAAGFINLIASFGGADAYSYVFNSQWGYLDHALASTSLVSQVTGAGDYHINSDEPSVLDYNTNFKSAGQISGTNDLFNADEFRTSDHDPVIVSLNLTAPVAPCTAICYADAAAGDDANPGTQALPKKTIQAALNQVDSGGTVIVAAGTYAETLIASKPVTLEGAGKDLLAKDRAGAQSIVKVSSGNIVGLEIKADDVIVNGFVFDMRGADTPWTILRLPQENDSRAQGLKLLYNEFIGEGGATQPANVDATAGGAYLARTDNTLIEGNFFNDSGSHAVFLAAYGDPNGVASNNAVYRNNDSFQNWLSNFSGPEGKNINVLAENNRAVGDLMAFQGVQGGTFRNNSFTGAANRASRMSFFGGSSNVTVEDTTFTNPRWQAILFFTSGSLPANSGVTIKNNIVTQDVSFLQIAYQMIDLRDVGGVNEINGNKITFSGSYPGAVGAAYGIGVRGAGTGTVKIINNELDGSNIASSITPPATGVIIRSKTPTNSVLPPTAVITVANNIVTGFSNGVAVYDAVANQYGNLPAGTTLTVELNSLAGNSVNGLITGASDPLLDAERNWWGSNTGPTNAGNPSGTGDSVSGNVDFTPWLCDGTDTSADRGFQPNPAVSPCGPQTGSLTVTKTVDWNGFPIDTTQVFSITVSGPGGYSSTQTVDYDGGSFTLSDLAIGSYTVSEINPGAGWDAPIITPASVTVSVGSTATATVANKHRAYSTLQLTSICSDFPNLRRNWRVTNPNPYPVTYSYTVVGTAQTGTLVANQGTSTFSTMSVAGPNTTIIKVNGVQQDVKASSGATCATVSACYASGKQVVDSFAQGKRKNGSAVLAVRSMPSKALGLPQKNDTENFVSLGFGGKIVIRFNNVIVNGTGADFQLWETTFGDKNRNWSSYPEAVTVEASQDGNTWVTLGATNRKDQLYDLKNLAWAKYVRLTDVSNKSKFGSTDDGFDVDAIEVKSGCTAPPAP